MPDFHDYCEIIFWDFERKNNTAYNFTIIERLTDEAIKSKFQSYFYKPIIILLMAVIECALYDFLWRVKQAQIEGVSVTPKQKKEIESTNIPNTLQSYLDICLKRELLGTKSSTIYSRLQNHIEYRNRIHIQNRRGYKPIKEYQVWTKHKVKTTGDLLRDIIIFICENYPRPERFHTNPDLAHFPTPWEKLP